MTVSEDRGTPAWLWRAEDGAWSFERPRRPAKRVEVSVPIGWHLRPDPNVGVVLTGVFGETLYAAPVARHAERGERGFRVRGREAT